jgi:hypothetical protein
MRIRLASESGNVGREDRLVRGGVALSLTMLGSFGVFAPGGMGPLSILFLVPLAYFGLTAIAGWDPYYARAGIDTRPQTASSSQGPDRPEAGEVQRLLDLTDRSESLLKH